MLHALTLPRTLFAPAAIAALPTEIAALSISRALVVSDHGVTHAGILARVLAAIGPGIEVVIADHATENPLDANADAGAQLYAAHNCDGVIAVGGGSVIDTAKYMALLATNPGPVADYAGIPDSVVNRCAKLLVIPTTAGTGSEASPDAGIHADATTASRGISTPQIVPHTAILDPQLTLSLPPYLTASTGIDALSHCIEGFCSTGGSALTHAWALQGIHGVLRHLRTAVKRSGDLPARTHMMAAAYAGGIAISAGLGPAHAIAITCSDQGFPHGILSGIGLICTLDLIQAHAPDRAAAVREAFGLHPTRSLSTAVAALMRELGLPATLHELGYHAPDVQRLATACHASPFNRTAPIHPGRAAYADMLATSLSPHASAC